MTAMKEFEQALFSYAKARGWENPRPGDLAKSISIEAAELLEHFQWGDPDIGAVLADKEKRTQVEKELADVMIYCFQLSMLMKLDTEKVLRKKLAAVKKKYPAKLVRKKGSKPEKEAAYWRIKKEHRMKGLS